MKKMMLGLLILWGAAALFAEDSSGALIREIRGTVEIKAPGAADWGPARQGQSIPRAAMISTGFKSSAVILVGNSVLSVQPLTRLTVEEIEERAGTERVGLSLQTGRIRAEVKPPSGRKTEFTLRGPSATASVRGTSFEFDGIHLRVDEGRVHLEGKGRTGAFVGAGHEARTDTDTGRMVGAAETLGEELAGPVPAGVDPGAAVKAAAPTGNVDVELEWE
jgi:hypothetical protein